MLRALGCIGCIYRSLARSSGNMGEQGCLSPLRMLRALCTGCIIMARLLGHAQVPAFGPALASVHRLMVRIARLLPLSLVHPLPQRISMLAVHPAFAAQPDLARRSHTQASQFDSGPCTPLLQDSLNNEQPSQAKLSIQQVT